MGNQFLSLGEIYADGDVLVFYVENQGVYVWGVGDVAGDPPVVGRINEPNEPWEAEGEVLSRFLLQVAMWEADGSHGAHSNYLPKGKALTALAHLKPCGVRPWRWPAWPTRFFAGEGVLAVTFPNGDPGDESMLTVTVKAKSVEAIRFMEPFISDQWDYFSLRD
jgi:hypothetical protein